MCTIPCEICGGPTTSLGTKRCNNCWELEARLDYYLKHKNGREFIEQELYRLKVETVDEHVAKSTQSIIALFHSDVDIREVKHLRTLIDQLIIQLEILP
jgi:FMN-dependent NADH-azoreductase